MFLARSPITAIILLAVIVTGAGVGIGTAVSYNALVSKQATVQAQWAQVVNQYQRKIDLIPSLVSAVSGYMQFERNTLGNITKLRSQWGNTTNLDQKLNVTNSIDNLLIQVRATYEAYPDLHSDQLVAGLMDELAGTENRIAVERGRFNDAVRDYNTSVNSFPSNLVANWFGFHATAYYNTPGNPLPS